MPKRKRDSEEAEPASTPLSAHQQRVLFKLKQGTAKLGHAFKTAKGFERQKLGRRRKTAAQESNAKDVQRIDDEIAALKVLENGKCAQHHLCKTLLKIKAVADSPDLLEEVRAGGTLSTDAAALNVHARLCNSNPVKDALPSILSEMQRALGLKVVKETLPKKRLRAKDYDKAEAEATKPGKSVGRTKEPLAGRGQDHDLDLEDVDMDTTFGGESFAGFDHRIALSGDEDVEDSDSDIDALERRLATEGVRTKPPSKLSLSKYDFAADMSLSASASESEDELASPPPRRAAAVRNTQFVPSLSLGGYISGSGSDLDDDIDVAPPPKNRRGQRARQKIWEQKYGAKAAHLKDDAKKPASQAGTRAQGWDMKRGATDGRERRGGRGGFGAARGGSRQDGGRGGRAAPSSGARETVTKKPDPKHRDDGGPIHPSWAAAKKAKELRDKPVAFQGKKVTFD